MNLKKMTLKQLKAFATERFGSRTIAGCMVMFEPDGNPRRGTRPLKKAYISLLSRDLSDHDLRRLQILKETEEKHQRLEAQAKAEEAA